MMVLGCFSWPAEGTMVLGTAYKHGEENNSAPPFPQSSAGFVSYCGVNLKGVHSGHNVLSW